MSQLFGATLADFNKRRAAYNGRYYYSSYTESDYQKRRDKYLVITSSTMAYVNEKKMPCLQSIECPGATIAETWDPLAVELCGMQPEKIVVILGVNNFLQAQSSEQACEETTKVQALLKIACPKATILWVPIPLVPKVCALPMDTHAPKKNRVLDILLYNDYLRNKLNHGYSPLSLETAGCDMRKKHTIPGHREFYLIGDKHWRSSWRERRLSEAVHLKDNFRFRFWREIESYFLQDDTLAYYKINCARKKYKRFLV